MKITKIQDLKNYRVFKNFTWGDLPEFNRYNFVYGWNGSGKTCLSDFFKMLSSFEGPPSDFEFNIEIEVQSPQKENITNFNFNKEKFSKVRIFNANFIRENLERDVLDKIFYVGKKNIDAQKSITSLKKEIQKNIETTTRFKLEKKEKLNSIEKRQKEIARSVKENLRSSDSNNKYNNYNITDIKKKCSELCTLPTEKWEVHESEKNLLKEAHDQRKDFIKLDSCNMPNLEKTANDVEEILYRPIINLVLKDLENDADLAHWTEKGLKLHKEKKSTVCLFCGNHISGKRLEQIEAHFNNNFEIFTNDISNLQAEIKKEIDVINDAINKLPDKGLLYESFQEAYRKERSLYIEEIGKIKAFLDNLSSLLGEKKRHPFNHNFVVPEIPPIARDKYGKLKMTIDRHNEKTQSFAEIIKQAREKYEVKCVSNIMPFYKTNSDAIVNLEKEIKSIEQRNDENTNKITQLETELRDYILPAEELNNDLDFYLGHNELHFKPEDHGYKIFRHDEIASNLSEGEKTAITLLYFLKSLKDEKIDISESIIIVDDPVSSLDANSLFTACNFINKSLEKAKQVFISTHNFYFFNQIKRSLGSNEERGFYQLVCTMDKDNQRSSVIKRLDDLLKKYDSEYQFLFKTIFNETNETNSSIERIYGLPNIARRLLETFLSFRYPSLHGSSLKKDIDKLFEQGKITKEENNQLLLLTYFTNNGSHNKSYPTTHDPYLLSETPNILKCLLDFIKKADQGHYDEMVTLVGNSPSR